MKLHFSIIIFLILFVPLQGAVNRYAKVSKQTHYGWVELGIQEVTYYSGWELRNDFEGINKGVLYCAVSVNNEGYGHLVELDYPVLATGMVFSESDFFDLYDGTRMVILGRIFGSEKRVRYRVQGRDFSGWISPHSESSDANAKKKPSDLG